MNHNYIGTITGSKGVNGSMLIRDTPKNIKEIPAGAKVFIGYSEKFSIGYEVKNWSNTIQGAILTLNEINSKEQVVNLKERGVFVAESDLKFVEGDSYYVDDIVGCAVIEKKSRKKIGEIVDVIELPANDIWVLQSGGEKIFLPFIDDVVKKVDLKNRQIFVNLMPGLIDLNKRVQKK